MEIIKNSVKIRMSHPTVRLVASKTKQDENNPEGETHLG
jgi:hypothetical protein